MELILPQFPGGILLPRARGAVAVNWRRGLFRLWIIGSALFVLAVAFVNYSGIKAEFDAVALQAYIEARGAEIMV